MTTLSPIWLPGAHQRVYRELLSAMAYPGRVREVDNDARPAHLAVLATLCDRTTGIADLAGMLTPRDRALLRAPDATPEAAAFVLCDGSEEPADFEPCLGDLENPERGATLIVLGASLGQGPLKLVIEGPGVDGQVTLAVNGIHPQWITRREAWTGGFPLGVDFVLCDEARIVALPRTARIRMEV